MKQTWCTAVVLAAGSGSRMKSNVAKQFLELAGRPLIYYALQAVEESNIIDECILVTGEDFIPWVRENIVEKYNFTKVTQIVAGGAERYASVANAMKSMEKVPDKAREEYVFIHDGARPFLTEEILERTFHAVRNSRACVAAMPSKDTVKIADAEGFAAQTPERSLVWNVQTPQVFEKKLIVKAYADMMKAREEQKDKVHFVTDDASVVEQFTDKKVKLVEGSYHNIKITTPEDMAVALAFLAENKA